MLDVLAPVRDAISAGGSNLAAPREGGGRTGAAATIPMRATKGRAAFLGERSVGHMDPGARSSQIIVEALSPFLEQNS